MLKHQTLDFQGGSPNKPNVDEDTYRSTDWIRDFAYQWQQAGRSLKSLLNNFPLLLSGGLVSLGASVTQIDITAAVGYVAHTVKVPVDYTTSPPVVTDETFEGVHVSLPAQTNYSISGTATLDGVSINYVKVQYAETDVNTRDRLKGAGSYAYEKAESYSLVVDTVAPTNLDMVLAEMVGDGSTFLTITPRENNGLKKLFIDTMFRDDSEKTIPVPAGYILWPLDSHSFSSLDGDGAKYASNISYIPSSDPNTLFNDRGVVYACGSCTLVYPFAWQNEGTIKIRIKPNWSYNTGPTLTILDQFSGLAVFTDNILRLQYNPVIQKFELLVRDDVSNQFFISSAAYTSDVQLQQWADFFIGWTKSGNDVKFYIDGVELDGTGGTIKTQTGAGITNIDLTAGDELTIAASSRGDNPYSENADMYFTNLLIEPDTFDDDTTNYDGSSIKDIYEYPVKRINGTHNLYTRDIEGNITANKISVPIINRGSGNLKYVEIPIGTWNMQATAAVIINIPSDLVSRFQLRRMDAIIFSDLTPGLTTSIYANGGGHVRLNNTGTFQVLRFAGGHFDNSSYNDTTLNRGWVIIEYVVI